MKIRAFLESSGTAPEKGLASRLTGRFTGWVDEVIGPAATVLGTLTPTQDEAERHELERLQRQYGATFIETIVFDAHHEGPLSWSLSEDQKRNIDCDWRDPRTQAQVTRLLNIIIMLSRANRAATRSAAPACR